MKILITGGAGFIGSNLCSFLTSTNLIPIKKIVVIDNLSLGKKKFIQKLIDNKKIIFYKEDLLNFDKIVSIFRKHKFDLVWHLSANSDIGYGSKYTNWDLKQGTIATYNILECMRKTNVKKIIFSSTSAIYGEAKTMPTPENYGPLLPISFYGASKLACESLITSFCHNFDFQAWIFRFGNIVGKNGTHGAIVDFIKKLKKNSKELEVLGNGKQAKPYLHVSDCIEGMIFGFLKSKKQVNFYNLACLGATRVSFIAKMVIKKISLKKTKIFYTGGKRGWKGDVTQVRLDPKKLTKKGWKANFSSDEAIRKAIEELVKQIN